jgi:RNA polymerase sigma factor (sigma-70 family)
VSKQEFLQLLQANQGIIYKLVALYAQNVEEKKDLYQEVVLQTWKAWPNFRGDAKFSTWLYRICLNTILTQQRKPYQVDAKTDLDHYQLTAENTAEKNQEAQRLRLAIRQLAETDRAIVSLHLDGYDNNEIAQIVGIASNHVAVKLFRIKQQLANLLKK